jgi:DNA-binding NarL/FixJ family response regulator
VKRRVQIVIADHQPMFREALRTLLESDAALQVVAETGDGSQALRRVAELAPDILLLDPTVRGLSALEVLRELGRVAPAVRTLLVAAQMTQSEIAEALQLGARGVLMKHSPTELLFKSIHCVAAGEYWVGRSAISELIVQLRNRPPTPGVSAATICNLTPRELEIVSTIAAGYTNDAIAARFSISVKTVKHHLTNIFQKVGVSNRIELALFAVEHGLEAAA